MSTLVTGSLVRVTFVRGDVNDPALGPLPQGQLDGRWVDTIVMEKILEGSERPLTGSGLDFHTIGHPRWAGAAAKRNC